MALNWLCCWWRFGATEKEDCGYMRFSDAPGTRFRPADAHCRVTMGDFALLRVIGRGTYGKVLLVRRGATSELFAMKSMRKADVLRRSQVAHMLTELSVLQRASHPFIAELHCSFQTAAKLHLVLAFYPGGELFFHLRRERRFAEPRVRLYAAEVLLALQALHRLDVVFRDLKPENVLLDATGHVRLSDFGLAKEAVSTLPAGARTCCGTPSYMAPEVLSGIGHSYPVDYWGLGTLVFEMLVGTPPHYSRNAQAMYQSILYGDLHLPPSLSRAAAKMLKKLLERDPMRRLGAARPPQARASNCVPNRNRPTARTTVCASTCAATTAPLAPAARTGAHTPPPPPPPPPASLLAAQRRVRRANFFRPLSFDRVLARGYTPAFVPALDGGADTANFAAEFTAEPAIDSLDSRVDELSAQQASQLETAFANWDCVAVGAELSAAPSPQHSFDWNEAQQHGARKTSAPTEDARSPMEGAHGLLIAVPPS